MAGIEFSTFVFSFCVLYLRGGASAGFSLSLKCERRQSMALPRTHSRTRSKQKRTGKNCCFFKSYLFFLRNTAVSAFNSFGFIRVCTAEPRPDFRCRSNANDGKAWLCRVLTRGLAPNKKEQAKPVLFCLERETRFELATFALARQRSTTEPFPHHLVGTIGLEPMTPCL